MNPIAFYAFGISIRWYGILIATGMLIGIIIAEYNCKARGVSYDTLINMVFWALPIGIIGARAYYVLFEFGNYKNNLIDIFNIRQGGLAIHGGVIAGLLTVLVYSKRKKLNFFDFVDAAIPSVIIAQALGRWGNFFNQEAHGGPVSYEFIKHFPAFIQKGMFIDGVYYHPTFLYESCWDLMVFIVLMILVRKSHKKGMVLFTYIGLYSLGRFFIEGLRTDSLMIGPIRMAQLVSLCGILMWLGYLVFCLMNKKGRIKE